MSPDRAALTRFAWLSIAAAALTIALKMGAWVVTGSVGLLSDALESIVNLVAASLALGMLTLAIRPADEGHAYGHFKAEYFASALEGVLVVVAALAIGWSAIDRLLNPREIDQIALGLAAAVVASTINLGVARVLFRAGRRARSIALEANARHLMADVCTSVGVVMAVAAVALTGWLWLDPVIALLVAANIVRTGIALVRDSALGLLDSALPTDERDTLEEILARYRSEGVQFHAIRTRQAGAHRFISFHILVPGQWTVARGHALAEVVEGEILAAFPSVTVFTHVEPAEDPVSWEDTGLRRATTTRGVARD